MKIGIYLGDIKKPRTRGELTFELTFVKELLRHKSVHEFIIYYFGQKNIFKDKQNCKFVCLKYFKKPEFSLFPLCAKTSKIPLSSFNLRLKKDNVNLVFFLSPYLHEHIEIPYYALIRDVAHRVLPHFPEYSSNFIFEKTEKKLNRFLTGATQIITGNAVAKNDIKTLYDVIDENILTIPLPYPGWIEETKEDKTILSKNNLKEKGYVLYPARYLAHKNHIRLILASQLMQEQNINLKVVFCGLDGGNKKYLINKTKELDLEENILFLDYLEQNELAALYKHAYALVYPALAGIDSLCALEALYFNCPVLISNHAGYNLQLKKSALYFNPLDEADILEKIKSLNDLAVLDEFRAKGEILLSENRCCDFADTLLNLADNFYLTRQCWSLGENHNKK